MAEQERVPLTPADLAALREDHKRVLTHDGTAWCLECDDFWPCLPAHLLTALDAARAALEAVHQVCLPWCEEPVNHNCCRNFARIRTLVTKALAPGAAVAADGARGEEEE